MALSRLKPGFESPWGHKQRLGVAAQPADTPHYVGRICFKDIIRSMILPKRLLRMSLIAALLAACAAQAAPPPATSLPTATATLAVPTTPTATATAPVEPPRLIAAGELYQDAAGDMAESFLDVIEFQATVDEDTQTLRVVFRLRDLPENVTRRQILNFVEYWWELSIYFAAPLQAEAQPDAGILVDTFASDPSAQAGEGIQTPAPGTPEMVPLNELWDDRFAYTAAGEILGVPEVVGDPSADTVTLTAQIPGITSAAVFTFSTFHFDGSMDRPDNYVDMTGPAAPVELAINAYPGPHHYEGDILTFEVTGLDGTSSEAELSLDGSPPFTVSGQWLTHDTLLLPLVLDTRGLTGLHELSLS